MVEMKDQPANQGTPSGDSGDSSAPSAGNSSARTSKRSSGQEIRLEDEHVIVTALVTNVFGVPEGKGAGKHRSLRSARETEHLAHLTARMEDLWDSLRKEWR